jgi:hypothetical protein
MATVAIQVSSRDNTDLAFTASERAEIRNEFKPWTVLWLPPNQTNADPDAAGSNLTTTILLFIAGITIGSALKSFFDGFFKEAGKDGWSGLKALLAKLWKTQADKAYALCSDAYVVFEFKEEHIALELGFGRIINGEWTEEDFQKLIDENVAGLMLSLDSIDSDIQRFGIGDRDANDELNIHVISRRGDKWIIHPVKNAYFFPEPEQEL